MTAVSNSHSSVPAMEGVLYLNYLIEPLRTHEKLLIFSPFYR